MITKKKICEVNARAVSTDGKTMVLPVLTVLALTDAANAYLNLQDGHSRFKGPGEGAEMKINKKQLQQALASIQNCGDTRASILATQILEDFGLRQ